MSGQEYSEYGPINPGNWDDLNAYLAGMVGQSDLDGILGSVAAVNWITLTLQNGYTNVGAPWAPARLRLTLNNVVHIEGAIHHNPGLPDATPVLVTTLPADARPGVRIAMLVALSVPGGEDDFTARAEVWADGSLYLSSSWLPNEHVITLAGINFSVGSAT